MKLAASLLLMSVFCHALHAQDLTNKGKDFWLGYGYHVSYTTGNSQEMVLYFATDAITTITVQIPGNGYTKTYANIPANTIFETEPLPKSGSQDARLANEQTYNTGIHVTSDKPVVAYAHIYNASISGATLLFPTSTLGKDYYSINYTQKSNVASSNGFFFVVAADTGTTTVEITPAAPTLLHPTPGVPFTVNLTQGQIYNVMGTIQGNNGVDLTGSHIRSISTGTNSCKRIAVFSGSGKIYINCGSGQTNSADNLFAQSFPKSAWGLRFLTAPTKNMEHNYFRVGVSDPAAVVKVNGILISGLINNFYYDLPLSDQPLLIESSLPATVAQYITTAGNGNQPTCGNRVPGIPADGDPEMIYLSPVEQTTDKVILNSTIHSAINQHFVNLIIKSNAVNSVIFDGSAIPTLFSTHPADPNYSYAQVPVGAGQHSVSADSGFNVIAYGYGNAESYGYNGGTNIKDLYQFISIINPNSIVNIPSACSQSPFYFSITLPYKPLSLLWNLHDPNRPNTFDNNPTPDSIYYSNGKTIYRYKLPIQYTYAKGTYPITVIANNPTGEGCPGEQQIDFDLNVFDPPVPDFYTISNGCINSDIQFKDTSNLNGRSAYKWYWDFGDGKISIQKNPFHQYSVAGTYKVRYSVITDIGCLSDTITKNVSVTNVPVASFSVSQPTCLNTALTFTDNSKLSGPGNLIKWVWDYNDGPTDSLTANGPRIHTYTTLKTVFPNLTVYSFSGCKSLPDTVPLVIHPFPVVDFSLPEVCLPGGVGQFYDSTKIADPNGTPFKYLWNFGDAPSGNKDIDSVKNPAHYFKTTGPYNISLQVTSANGCVSSINKSLIDIYPPTKSSFTVNTENCLNDSTHFSDKTDAPQFPLVKWHWDFGDGSIETTQNPIHVYASAGTFNIKFYGITSKGCNTDTTIKQVIINPLPSATFTSSLPDCVSKNILFTDNSSPNAGNINAWFWNFGDGNTSTLQSPSNAYAAVGNYKVVLNLSTDKGCKSNADTMQITINPLPVAGFISPEVCLSDAVAQFVDSSKIVGGSITNWTWNFGDPSTGALNTSTLQNPKHQYHAVGNYPVQLLVTTNNLCTSTIIQTITVNGDKPKANFTVINPTALCVNDSVVIQDGSSVDFGNITKLIIFWDDVNNPTVSETDETPFPGKIYHHLYPDFQQPLSKSFTIRYRVFSGISCLNEITRTILIHSAPKVVFNAMPDVCFNASAFQITQAKETGGVPGIGSFAGAGVSASGIFTPSVAGVGLHTIHYTFTSSSGCVDTASNIIKVLQPPVANFSYSSLNCEKAAITFKDSSTATDGKIVKWIWNFNDGSPVFTQNSNAPFTHTFNTANTYNVTLTVTTDYNCNSTTFSKQIIIHPYPIADFTASKSCLPNANVLFTNSSKIGDGTLSQVTYLWDFGDPNSGGSNNVSTQTNPAHIYTAVGPYNIHLIATSSNGCIRDTIKVYNDIHPQPIANFIPSIIEICVGSSITFNDKSTNSDGTINAWLWNFGDGSSASVQSPSHTFTTAGNFSVMETVTNSNACVSDVFSLPITVDAFPTVNAQPDRFVLEGDTIHLSPVYAGVGLTYLWTPPDYLNNDKVPFPILTGVNDRVYTISVTGKGDCSVSDKLAVKVLRTLKVPNTFSPNQDGINDFWLIENLQDYKNARVQIFDRYGQTMFESVGYSTPWDGNYKGKPVPFGTYYYIIEPGNGRKPITGYVTVLK